MGQLEQLGQLRKPLCERKGFTLVEVLVATGVLVFVITIVVGIYVTTVAAQNRTFARQAALDSSRFALESIARSIRQSNIDAAGTSAQQLALTDHPTKGSVTYTLSDGRLTENGDSITASNVAVDTLSFTVDGITDGDNEQPRVTILMEVRSTNARENEQATIPIQTTITPRNLDQ